MEIKFDKDKMSEVVSAAILSAMAEGEKDRLVKEAITSLLEKDRWGNIQIQEIFKSEVRTIATEWVREALETNENLRAHLKAAIQKALAEVTTKENMDKIATYYANAVIASGKRTPY